MSDTQSNPSRLSRRAALRVALAAVALSFAFVQPAVADASEPSQGVTWEKVRDDDGILVHKREIAGSPMIAFRGEGIIDAPIAKVGSVLVDISRSTEWIDSLKEARHLRKISETEYISYNHVGTPVVMKDRDFVVNTKLEFDPPGKRLIIRIKSVTDPAAPVTDFIRGEIHGSAFELTSIEGGKKTKIVTEIHADPKGSVSSWLVNAFQRNWPHNTIMRLRAQVAKPDVKDFPMLVDAMAAKGYFGPPPPAPPSAIPPPPPAPPVQKQAAKP